MALTFTRHSGAKGYEIRPLGSAPIHVHRGVPEGWQLSEGCRPRFTIAADAADAEPLAVVVRTEGGRLAVLASGGERLAELCLPARKKRWRPMYEIRLAEGTVARGREGSVPSLLLCLVVLPFVLLYLVAMTLSDSPADIPTATLRTVWKRPGGVFGRAVLRESARGRFRVREELLDRRVAYAQAVAKYWER
ncbi:MULTISPECIES: hypothetical protein [Streptomyces]|uniref:Uncharacterized protein n=3 Tax=Streptomyces rimosus TaxID=1927 RepID=L8F1L6_STRR1|nr:MULTISPECIES: hypothetical protein [Streptomyces]MYT47431.1 hypothetical protein [Streptomyces sp. SID5471]KEF07875.1 hypothetical protein DF17_06190 [Streptomyces rimosus]KOT71631.1 hypothetical protein ADK48_37180 [Streptomyces rimosus subsp. rimosus]QDA05805.1 hypothetical protein CTZ40_20570 [Streptomyces rimosus]QEV77082.1 hypothetical protein CP984_20525 [Streptomyces rimosus]